MTMDQPPALTGINLAEAVEQSARYLAGQIITIPGWAGELDFVCDSIIGMMADLKTDIPDQAEAPSARAEALWDELASDTAMKMADLGEIDPAEARYLYERSVTAHAPLLKTAGITINMVTAAMAARVGEILREIATGDPDQVVDRYGDILSAESRNLLLRHAIAALKDSGVSVTLRGNGNGQTFVALGGMTQENRIPRIILRAARRPS